MALGQRYETEETMDTKGPAPIPAPLRFWPKVYLPPCEDDCWLWTAAKDSHGYGQFSLGRTMVPAHRWAYESEAGPIPLGLTIDHLCRVRHCVNPAHLEPVTIGENIMRGEGLTAHNARSTHCLAGHPYDDANTYHRSHGGRECRICTNRRSREYRARKGSTP